MVCASLIYLLALSLGKQTVRLIPSKTNPIKVLVVSKFLSPLSSFPLDIGSLPFLWLVMFGSGKTACIPWMAALRTIARCFPSFDWVAAWQKLSSYTYRSLVGLSARDCWGTSGMVISSLTGWCGRSVLLLMKCCVRSRAHSVTAQKYAGLSTHPI